jgi:hypothetical protein
LITSLNNNTNQTRQDFMSNSNGAQNRASLAGWQELLDPKTQRVYFHNPTTGEVSWDHPTHPTQPTHRTHSTLKNNSNVENGKKPQKEKKQPRTIYAIYKALRTVKSVEGLPNSQFTPKEVFFQNV